MNDIIDCINIKINKYKPSKVNFRELFDTKVNYKIYQQYKKLFLSEVKKYYEEIDICDETVDSIKVNIEFNELKFLFLAYYYSKTLNWNSLSKSYKINFVDYVNCYELLKLPEYLEFEIYLNEFNITDYTEILNELKNI